MGWGPMIRRPPMRWRRHRRRPPRSWGGIPYHRFSETHSRYPGLTANPHVIRDFDADPTLPLVRYRILVDGREDASGEFHSDPSKALGEVTRMMSGARYAPHGMYMAEVEVYDAEGGLIDRDRHVRTWLCGRLTVVWQSDRDHWREARRLRWELPMLPMRRRYASLRPGYRPRRGWLAWLFDR